MDTVETASTETLSDQFEADKTLNAEPKQDSKPAEPQQPQTKVKVKVDGVESEVDLDELKRGYSHAKAAADRMRKAQETIKSVEPIEKENKQWRGVLERISKSEDDFWEFAESMGYKLDEIVSRKALDIIKLEQMSEQDRLKELEYRQLKKKSLTWQEQEAQQSKQKEVQDYAAVESRVDNEVAQVLQKNSCRDPRVLEQMILIRMKDANTDWDSAYSKAHQAIANRDKAYRQRVLAELDPNELPDDVRARLRKADVESLKGRAKPYQSAAQEPKKTQTKIVASTDDYFKQMEKRFK